MMTTTHPNPDFAGSRPSEFPSVSSFNSMHFAVGFWSIYRDPAPSPWRDTSTGQICLMGLIFVDNIGPTDYKLIEIESQSALDREG
ncbi:MAG: hypothetical protein KF841_03910 [Phycisphaerae bacterium]|nr:hypothetical protein [Phycisphaerae bacterium]